MALKLAGTIGHVAGPVMKSKLFNLNDVMVTTLTNDHMGLLLVGIPTDSALAVIRLECGNITSISSHDLFTKIKDNPSTYNGYFEDGFFKVQNKVGDGKMLKMSIFGLELRDEI